MGFRKSTSIRKPNLFKRFYKEIILIIVGLVIGTSIGGIGRVSDSKVEEAKSNIEEASKDVKNKESELKKLNDKKNYLEKSLKNQE